jgi:hypothetical protein
MVIDLELRQVPVGQRPPFPESPSGNDSPFNSAQTVNAVGNKSFALNASSEAAAKTVFNVLESLRPEIVKFIENHFIDGNEHYTAIHGFASWFFFSDTIVFFIPENPFGTLDEAVRGDCASYAAVAMELLQSEMLREGLPIRGTLHHGDFFQNGVSFAGKGVIEAAMFCDKMEMAGIIVTETITPLLRFFPDGSPRYDGNSLVRYKVPFRYEEKIEEGDNYTVVRKWIDTKALFLLTDEDELTLAQTDVEDSLEKSFSAHGKSVESPSAQIKMQTR